MRRFELWRDADETGVSGTGHVADGCVFEGGKVTLCWRTKVTSVAVYDSMSEVLAIHGHGGKTRVVMIDANEGGQELVQFCERCFARMDYGVPHCFNCGAGGAGVYLLERQVKSIREQASWVGKRFYSHAEDLELGAELRRLRVSQGEYPGRKVELRDDPVVGRYWAVTQEQPQGASSVWISTTVPWQEGDNAAVVLRRSGEALPWWPASAFDGTAGAPSGEGGA